MKKLALIMCLATAFSLTAMAQNSGGSGSEQNAWGEAYLGYAHVTGQLGQNGWEAAAAKNFNKHWAGEADFTGSYGNQTLFGTSFKQHQYSFLFGPKYMITLNNTDKWTPFVHLLFGFGHTGVDSNVAGVPTGATSFAWALGGGADYNLTSRWAARAKLDVFHTDYFKSGDSHARFGFGIVYKFGSSPW